MGARAHAARALHRFGAAPGAHARVLIACASLLLALLGAGPARAGWQSFGLADGMPSLSIRAIATDHSENLWFGTLAGASRYNGATFRTFKTSDGLISDVVHCLLTDRAGRIWFGTPDGVSVLDSTHWTSYPSAGPFVWDDVRSICEDSAGRMWFATDFGAIRFDGVNWTRFTQADGLASDALWCVFQDVAGNMWFGTQTGGVSRWDGTTWTTFTTVTTSGGLGDNSVKTIHQTRDGILWFGTEFGGLSRFDGSTWLRITNAGPITLGGVTGLRQDRFGSLWVSCIAGLARYDGRVWRSYTIDDGLAGDELKALEIDGSGNIWSGTGLNGISRYDGESFTSFDQFEVPEFGNTVLSVIEDDAGSIWAATDGGGAVKYDRSTWTVVNTVSTGGGLAGNRVNAVLQDSTGSMWFGTTAGASRFNGAAWQTFTSAGGPIGDNITVLARDSSGTVWMGTNAGVSRYDGTNWTSYTTADGLPANLVRSLHVARDGSIWVGTSQGVAHREGPTWRVYSTADGLARPNVYAILEDHAGVMWFGTNEGLSRFDGTTWRTYLAADGLANSWVRSLAETPDSVLWVGTNGGLSRFEDGLWTSYRVVNGLPDNQVNAIAVERAGNLWLGTQSAVALFETPRVTPQTVITTPPPALSANRLQSIPFVAAFRQSQGIEFSTALDTGEWSDWSPELVWVGRDLGDGVHTFRVRARNLLHFTDPTPATAVFEIAATPPIPILAVPAFRQPARDTLAIQGTANALRFRSLKLEMRPAGAQNWDPPQTVVLAQSTTPVIDSVIARLSTKEFPDGDYDLRLTVQDTLGLVGYAQVTFVIDNVEPFAAQTTPAQVSALSGGDVFTTNRETHVYIPPRGLPQDAIVSITRQSMDAVPGSLPDGATLVDPGVSIAMTDLQNSQSVALEKTAILDHFVSIATISFPQGMRLAFYSEGANSEWKRIGGTLDEANDRFSTTFTAPGRFALYAAPEDAVLSSPMQLSLTPRVLSSRGPAATSTVKIAFVMARAGSARVTVHNKAGRLMKVVMDGQPLAPGTNLVNWDGRDNASQNVPPGMYFVTVEALGDAATQAVGVVR